MKKFLAIIAGILLLTLTAEANESSPFTRLTKENKEKVINLLKTYSILTSCHGIEETRDIYRIEPNFILGFRFSSMDQKWTIFVNDNGNIFFLDKTKLKKTAKEIKQTIS